MPSDKLHEGKIECPKCGAEVEQDKKVCPNCGTWLGDVGRIRQATPWGKRTRVQ